MSPVRLCFVDGTIPAARRIICDRIARLTARDGDNLADAFIAAKIGEALGSAFNWDEESIKTLHDEREAYIAIAMPDTQTAAEGSCEFVDKVLDFVTEEGALGTRKYAKKLLLNRARQRAKLPIRRARHGLSQTPDNRASTPLLFHL